MYYVLRDLTNNFLTINFSYKHAHSFVTGRPNDKQSPIFPHCLWIESVIVKVCSNLFYEYFWFQYLAMLLTTHFPNEYSLLNYPDHLWKCWCGNEPLAQPTKDLMTYLKHRCTMSRILVIDLLKCTDVEVAIVWWFNIRLQTFDLGSTRDKPK